MTMISSTQKTSLSKPAGNADKDVDEAQMSVQLEKSQQVVSAVSPAIYPLTSPLAYKLEEEGESVHCSEDTTVSNC